MSACAITRSQCAASAAVGNLDAHAAVDSRANIASAACFAAVHAIGNADAAIGRARNANDWKLRDRALDLRDRDQMTDRILRHRGRPAPDFGHAGRGGDTEQLAKLLARRSDHVVVGEAHHVALQHAADESSREDRARGRASFELEARKTARDYFALLDRRHHEAERVGRLGKIALAPSQIHRRRRRVADVAEMIRQPRCDAAQQARRRVSRRRANHRVGFDRLVRSRA